MTDNKNGRWVTINGAHVFIENGKTVNQAMQERFGEGRGKKRVSEGKHEYSTDNGKTWFEMSRDAYDEYDADSDDFDANEEDDFGFDDNDLDESDLNESKKILDQMSEIRNEEKEKEANLLREWAVNKSISYDEFKDKEQKLHQEAQNRIDSLYKDLNGIDSGGEPIDYTYLKDQFGLSDDEASDFADFLYDKGVKGEDKAVDFYAEWASDYFDIWSNEETAGAEDEDAAPSGGGLPPRKSRIQEEMEEARKFGFNPEDEDEFQEYLGAGAGYDRDAQKILMNEWRKEIKKPRTAEEKLISNKGIRDQVIDDTLKGTDVNSDAVKTLADYKYAEGYEPEDIGNMRTFPNKTGSNMDKNNHWIGSHHSISEAHGVPRDKFRDSFLYQGLKTKNGSDIFKGPDGYYSLNPNIYGESFKTIEDLEDYYDNEGDVGTSSRYGKTQDRYDAYSKRKGLNKPPVPTIDQIKEEQNKIPASEKNAAYREKRNAIKSEIKLGKNVDRAKSLIEHGRAKEVMEMANKMSLEEQRDFFAELLGLK